MKLAHNTAGNTSSMLADVLAGREAEIEFINGQIVKIEKSVEVHIPENELVVRRIREWNT